MATTVINKIDTNLNKIYKQYTDERKAILNHSIMFQYLFRKPLCEKKDLITASNVLDTETYFLRLNDEQYKLIDGLFLLSGSSFENYYKTCDLYIKITNEYNIKNKTNINFAKNIPHIFKLTPAIKKITNILDDMNIQNYIDWSFTLDDEHLSANKRKPYIFNTELSVDIFGYIYKKNKFYQYAIEYDSRNKRYTRTDYFKQYCLQQMGIHLLRLKSNSRPISEIKKFIRSIKNSDTYIIQNGLTNIPKCTMYDKLQTFFSDYEYNHTLYLKYYPKSDDEFTISDQEFDDIAPDDSHVVSHNFMDYIISKNNFFSGM